jgi:hypothetical protein
MKKRSVWKKVLAIGLLGGSVLFQAPTCTDQAAAITAISSAVSAAGVLYLVEQVVNN